MRRTRSLWQYALFAVPAVFVAVGLTFLSKHHDFGGRTIASVTASPEDHSQLKRVQQSVQKKIAQMDEDEDAPVQDLKVDKAEAIAHPTDATRAPAAAADSGVCTSTEFPGKSPESVKPTAAEWQAVMREFHAAKTQVGQWLVAHKTQFSEKTFQWMQARVTGAQLISPPADSMPDLSWRGIGVIGESDTQAPVIRVGGGMIKWVAEKPQRARFEFARLLAQAWAPCEIAKIDTKAPWKDLVSCLDLSVEADPEKVCGAGSYSEAAWAVSSVVAAAASPPGCRIPAFDKVTVADCAKKMGVPL